MRAERNIPFNPIPGSRRQFSSFAADTFYDPISGIDIPITPTGAGYTGNTGIVPPPSSNTFTNELLASLNLTAQQLVKDGAKIAIDQLTPKDKTSLMTLYAKGKLPGYELDSAGNLVPKKSGNTNLVIIGGLAVLAIILIASRK